MNSKLNFISIKWKQLIIIIFLLSINKAIFSQHDTSLEFRLLKPVIICETVSINSQEMLAKMDFSQTDSILRILWQWEKYCGNNEPIIRLKMLIAISKKEALNSFTFDYFQKYLPNYYDRINCSEDSNCNNYFESSRSYFNYVPINGIYDQWTKNIATELLKLQEKNSTEHLYCLLWTNQKDSFERQIKSYKYRKTETGIQIDKMVYDSWSSGMTYTFNVGQWYPLAKMSETFNQHWMFGARMGFRGKNEIRFDFGFQARLLSKTDSFEVNIKNINTRTSGSTSLALNGLITKEIPINRFTSFEIRSGVGFEIISTNIIKNAATANTQKEYYDVTTIGLNAGIGIRQRIFLFSSIGISIDYHFVPYNLDDLLISNIGNQLLSLNFNFRW